MPDEDRPPQARPLAIDDRAASTSHFLPAFLARPAGAPVYHGFAVLADVVVDGFTLGAITDFMADPYEGDAFLIAPDNSRAGLVWNVSDNACVERILQDDEERWGVWAVSIPLPMTSRENVVANLAVIVPLLKPKWESWRADRAEDPE